MLHPAMVPRENLSLGQVDGYRTLGGPPQHGAASRLGAYENRFLEGHWPVFAPCSIEGRLACESADHGPVIVLQAGIQWVEIVDGSSGLTQQATGSEDPGCGSFRLPE